MARLLYTIWALFFDTFDLFIFRTCFANAMEDEDRESLLCGPPFSSFFFTSGIYIIIIHSNLFPRTFRQPQMCFLVIYEFLATAFLLEFALACIWTPIDVLISTRLPTTVCHVLQYLGSDDTVIAFFTSKTLMAIITYIISITFLLLILHVTDSVDYTILRDFGPASFAIDTKERLWDRLQRELPFLNKETRVCRCRVRRRGRSKSHLK